MSLAEKVCMLTTSGPRPATPESLREEAPRRGSLHDLCSVPFPSEVFAFCMPSWFGSVFGAGAQGAPQPLPRPRGQRTPFIATRENSALRRPHDGARVVDVHTRSARSSRKRRESACGTPSLGGHTMVKCAVGVSRRAVLEIHISKRALFAETAQWGPIALCARGATAGRPLR